MLSLLLLWKDRSILTRHFALFVLVSGITIGAAAAYALFTGLKDSTQLFFNIVNALLNSCLIWAIIRCFCLTGYKQQNRFLWHFLVLGVLLTVIFFKQIPQALKKNVYPVYTTAYSDTYLQQIKTYILDKEGPTIGAAIKGGKDYKSLFSKQTAAYTLGYYLGYMENGSLALQISDFEIPKPTANTRKACGSNLFYRFVNQQKSDGTFESIGVSQVAFIHKYALDFVVLSKRGLLRKEVKELVRDSIVDSVSGEQFLILRK